VSLLVASSDQSVPLAAGARAYVQADGNVRTGPPPQVDGEAGRSADGRIMLERMEALRRYLPPGRQIAFSISTPPSDDLDDEPVFPIGPTIPTLTGAGGGGRPAGASGPICSASCN
jgi:hypothetical protein